MQRLIAAGVVDGVAIEPSLAARLVRLRAADTKANGVTVDQRDLEDALDEAVFIDQRETEQREQAHFEQAIGQLERFVDDKVLVCRRERASVAEKLGSARERRDTVVGFSARERVQEEIARLESREAVLERRIGALESREDEVYRKWRNDYYERRYQAPTVTRLFQVTFRIAAAKPRRS